MRRYALRDDQWDRIKDQLPGCEGYVGVTARDNRLFVEAVLNLIALVFPGVIFLTALGRGSRCTRASPGGPKPEFGSGSFNSWPPMPTMNMP